MEIYGVAKRLRDAEERMKKNITAFSAASVRQWGEDKEKLDESYASGMEEFRSKLAAETDSKISSLKASFRTSAGRRKSVRSRKYGMKARKAIREVVAL